MEPLVPKFGVLTNPFMDIISEIKEIHSLGFDYVEVGIEMPGGMPEIIIDNKKKILALLKKFPSPSLAHTGWMVDLGTPYNDIRRAWIDEGKNDIVAANELGISLINFHGISNFTFLDDQGMKKRLVNNYVKSLRELVKFAKGLEIEVMLENIPTTSASAFSEYKHVIDNVKGLWVHLDVAHAYINDGMKKVNQFVKTFDKRIAHIHFSDSLGNDDHLPIGKGNIDYGKVVDILKKMDYSKTITFEVFTDNRQDAVKSRERIKKMWEG